jgi:hypothetical protein
MRMARESSSGAACELAARRGDMVAGAWRAAVHPSHTAVSGANGGSKQEEQNSGPEKSTKFHECCLHRSDFMR